MIPGSSAAHWLSTIRAIGSSPWASTAVSGLIAAAGWVKGGWRGMARLALPWIAVNIVIGRIGGAMPIPIGWVAHIGGTIGGMLLTPLVIAVFAEDGV